MATKAHPELAVAALQPDPALQEERKHHIHTRPVTIIRMMPPQRQKVPLLLLNRLQKALLRPPVQTHLLLRVLHQLLKAPLLLLKVLLLLQKQSSLACVAYIEMMSDADKDL